MGDVGDGCWYKTLEGGVETLEMERKENSWELNEMYCCQQQQTPVGIMRTWHSLSNYSLILVFPTILLNLLY